MEGGEAGGFPLPTLLSGVLQKKKKKLNIGGFYRKKKRRKSFDITDYFWKGHVRGERGILSKQKTTTVPIADRITCASDQDKLKKTERGHTKK